MAMTDPLGDLLTRIRNGQQARKDSILTPASKLRAHVLDVLQREGYIRGYTEEELAGQKGLRIELKYFEGQPAIQHLARVSKPGRRVYSGAQELPRIRNGLGTIIVSTPRGVLSDEGIKVEPANETKEARAFWGMQRTLVQNLVTGVTEGFSKTLEITGVGYRAQAQGRNLRLQLGYSHDVNYPLPEGVDVKTPDQNTVEISGIDRQEVGQVAAEIRRWRKPEPYKGKGIKYRGEYIFRKEGKKK